MPSILITGANRGLGLEFAKQYASEGYRVFATCRRPDQAEALQALAKSHAKLSIHPLTVGDPTSTQRLAAELSRESIDILLNNAGVMGARRQSFGAIDANEWLETFRINTIGPYQMCVAFLEQVARSEKKLMVAVTSGMGSIADSGGSSYVYRTSKAALNMAMHTLAIDLKDRGIISIVINPGWVQTDMGGPRANQPPERSISAMRQVFAKLKPEDSGKFFNYDGGSYPW